MTHRRGWLAACVAALALLGSARWGLFAQDNLPNARPAAPIEEAMQRSFTLPFGDDTSLDDVAKHLSTSLHAHVVLDLAALKRQALTPQSPVRLQLEGVRLKTGLQLLLDQVGLTTKTVPEDNLLILTDATGSGDPTDRIFAELRTLHHEIHDLRAIVDDLNRSILPAEEPGDGQIRKPTIIEDAPADKGKMPDEPPARSRPGL